jgi:hypothetical protein
VGRELTGRRNRGAGFLRTGVRRRVRSGRFGWFWSVWFETSWPGGGVGRLVHASSLVRPPDGRCAQPIDAGTLPRQAAPNLGRRHTAGRRRGLGWNRPDRNVASVKGVAVAIQADAIVKQ